MNPGIEKLQSESDALRQEFELLKNTVQGSEKAEKKQELLQKVQAAQKNAESLLRGEKNEEVKRLLQQYD
ncbi:MAG: hypothetical protein Q4B28_02675 [bacterium]|nr:hypothetical protein [bacterium]